jgi:hypothetical protein
MMLVDHSIRRYIAPFFSTCRILRAPLFVSVLAFAVLGLLPQTREVYRVLADDLPNQQWQVVFGFVALLLASGFIWHCGRQATLVQRQHMLGQPNLEGALLRWMPRVLAALVPLGAAIGLCNARVEAVTTAGLLKTIFDQRLANWSELHAVHKLVEGSPTRLLVAALICVGLVAVVLVATILRTRGMSWKYERAGKWLMGREVTILSLAIVAACVAAFSFAQPSFAQSIGAVAIFGVFIVALVVVTTSLTALGDRVGVPILLCIFVWAIALGVRDKNDNHTVTLTMYDHNKNANGPYRPEFYLRNAFRHWYDARKDREHYEKKGDPYPVFIVAAAGGGTYAAHYTATFLARLQDRCPSFAQHTFAISGVSGGSLGATVFAGLAKQLAKNGDHVDCDFYTRSGEGPGPFEKKVQAIFRADFLSPVLAAGLFPDLLQRLLPWPVSHFDRAKALDATLEAAWRSAMEPEGGSENDAKALRPLEKSFLDLWAPQRNDEAVPALVLNTTEVANGYRTIISPLYLDEIPRRKWGKVQQLHETIYERMHGGEPPQSNDYDPLDIKLSTAAGISARFPIVLPAASIEPKRQGEQDAKNKFRLVDGGYVESSAVETANDIIQVLKGGYRTSRNTAVTLNADLKFKLYLIVLMGYEGEEAHERSLGETSIPMRTLISTWGSRGEQTFMRAYVQNCFRIDRCYEMFNESRRPEVETDVAAVFLNLWDFNLPLTWQLTEASRKIISLHAGVARRCDYAQRLMLSWTDVPVRAGSEKEDRGNRIVWALEENNCSACLLQYKLANRAVAPDVNQGRWCSRPPTVTGTTPP